jgi:hypothetical protein
VYTVDVMRGDLGDIHRVYKRYSDFVALCNDVAALSGITLQLPPKKMFGNKDAIFIAKRKEALDVSTADASAGGVASIRHSLFKASFSRRLHFIKASSFCSSADAVHNSVSFIFRLPQALLQQAAHDPHLQLSLPVRRFLDPSNYAADFMDDALKGVHMFFRSEPSWEIIEVLYGMGWRMRKSHVIVEYVRLAFGWLLAKGIEAAASDRGVGSVEMLAHFDAHLPSLATLQQQRLHISGRHWYTAHVLGASADCCPSLQPLSRFDGRSAPHPAPSPLILPPRRRSHLRPTWQNHCLIRRSNIWRGYHTPSLRVVREK